MKINQPIFLIVLVFVLASTAPGYSQNGAAFNSLQPVLVKGNDGNAAKVTEKGQSVVVMESKIDAGNSTKTPLASSAVFTGAACEILDYSGIAILVGSDVAGVLTVQYSPDAVDWYDGETYVILASAGKFYTPPVQSAYYRLVYVNGGLPQTSFYIHSVLKAQSFKWSSHNITEMIKGEDDAILTKTVLTAEDEAGEFVNIRSIQGDTGYNLKVSLDQIDSSTNSVKMIDYSHAELHAGDHYVWAGNVELDSAASKTYLLTTPNTTKWIHMSTVFDGSAITQFAIYEGADRVGTTAKTPLNRNRNSVKTAGLVIHEDVSGGTTDGTLLPVTHKSGSATNQANSPATARSENEIILKQNTKYLIRLTSFTNDNLINATFDWYEHTNN